MAGAGSDPGGGALCASLWGGGCAGIKTAGVNCAGRNTYGSGLLTVGSSGWSLRQALLSGYHYRRPADGNSYVSLRSFGSTSTVPQFTPHPSGTPVPLVGQFGAVRCWPPPQDVWSGLDPAPTPAAPRPRADGIGGSANVPREILAPSAWSATWRPRASPHSGRWRSHSSAPYARISTWCSRGSLKSPPIKPVLSRCDQPNIGP